LSDTLKPAPAIAPATLESAVRCPLQAASVFFEGRVCRCVLRDDHAGRCKVIDGRDLTADAYLPHVRYVLMGLEAPARLVPVEGPS
jgi:hypothetical protein